jgi:peptidoglycan/LPS O-acetylase OafA/YrhL
MSSATPSIREIRALTGLRGVAAIYVVFLHFFMGVSRSNRALIILGHGYLAVDLFFILSGFVLALNYSYMFASGWSLATYIKFLGRRIARIYPLYVAGTLVGFCLVVAGWLEFSHSGFLGVALFENIIMIQIWGVAQSFDPPGWSISAEWAAYLLFPLLLVPTMFGKPALAWISALICAAALTAFAFLPPALYGGEHYLGEIGNFQPWHALPMLRCIPEFVFGILACRIATTPFGLTLAASRWIGPALCVAILGLMAIPSTDVAVVFLFPLLVLSVASGTNVPGRLLASTPAEFAGRLSYSIYLVHYLLVGVMHWVHGLAHASGLAHAQTYAAAVGLVLTFPISYLAYRFIEVPGRTWLRVLFEGRPADKNVLITAAAVGPA